MIVLEGKISYFSLAGLLRFIYANKLTGVLYIRKKDKAIEIHILTGKPLGVEPSERDPIDQLIEVSTWINGDFEFVLTPEESLSRNITVPHDQLILLIAKKEKEFKEIKNSLPPLSAVLLINPAGQNGEIRLQPDEWNLLSKVDGKKNLEQIVHTVDLDEISAFGMVVKMLRKGILSVQTSEQGSSEGSGDTEGKASVEGTPEGGDSEKVPVAKIKEFEKIFMRYVGPMGTIILDEILETKKIERTNIGLDMIADLIEKMSNEIDSEDDRLLFEEEAYKLFGLKKEKIEGG